jgi:hypothetical protein
VKSSNTEALPERSKEVRLEVMAEKLSSHVVSMLHGVIVLSYLRTLRKCDEVELCQISSTHGGENEAQILLGCTAVFLIERRSTLN